MTSHRLLLSTTSANRKVEEIIDVRKRNRKLQAKAKWINYDVDSTWYPITDFLNAKDILRDFYHRNPAKLKPA